MLKCTIKTMGGPVALAYLTFLMCRFPPFRPLGQAPTDHTTHGQDGMKLDFRGQSGRLLSLGPSPHSFLEPLKTEGRHCLYPVNTEVWKPV